MLHIINKSPLERNSLDSCLRVASEGSILLIEDAVYAATRGHAGARRSRRPQGASRSMRFCPTSRRGACQRSCPRQG
jgi:hypothetical protein